MGAFPGENLLSDPFPGIHGKLVDCGNARNQRSARASASHPEIKLGSNALIPKRPHPLCDTRWSVDWRIRFRFRCAQKGFGERIRHEGSRPCPRGEIAFGIKL